MEKGVERQAVILVHLPPVTQMFERPINITFFWRVSLFKDVQSSFNLEIPDFQSFVFLPCFLTQLLFSYFTYSHSHVPTVCTLACAPLLFPDHDIKCYGLN